MTTLAELRRTISSSMELVRPDNIILQYEDDEKDLITIGSQSELFHLLELVSKSAGDDKAILVLRVKVLKRTPKMRSSFTAGTFMDSLPNFDDDSSETGDSTNKTSARKLEMPNEWIEIEIIGVGGFGTVYSGLNVHTGEMLAIKKIQLDPNVDMDRVADLESEVRLLSRLNHQNIVTYIGCHVDNQSHVVQILLEYVPGSLKTIVDKLKELRESLIVVYTKQILQGLKYLHSNGIVHRDIKCANILLDQLGNIKLSDFGTAKRIKNSLQEQTTLVTKSHLNSFAGTSYWMAPEVIKQDSYKTECDIWSLGCTVIEMATGNPPFSTFSTTQLILQIGKDSLEIPELPTHLSHNCKDFISSCLTYDQHLRPTVEVLLHHALFTSNKKNKDINITQSLDVPKRTSKRKSKKDKKLKSKKKRRKGSTRKMIKLAHENNTPRRTDTPEPQRKKLSSREGKLKRSQSSSSIRKIKRTTDTSKVKA